MNQKIFPLKSLNGAPLDRILKTMDKNNDCVFLETKRYDRENRKSFLFLKPEEIVSCYCLGDLEEKLKRLDEALNQGYFIAGFIGYEAGYRLEEIVKTNKEYSFPLLWFGIYKRPYIYEHNAGRFVGLSEEDSNFLRDLNSKLKKLKGRYVIKDIKPNLSESEYIKDIKKIKEFIRSGETYQVNFTFKHKFSFSGSVYELYKDLREKQSVCYSALIKFDNHFILSFSPELFFRKNKDLIETRPMKGTLKRGKDLAEDSKNIRALKKSIKNRSENVMIVDLLRNDLGRISEIGSVKTKELFKVEKYETLLQMISIIKSTLRKDILFSDIFKNIFPCGSVTGAPKVRTMQIIKQLEREPRLVYTGNIGYVSPKRESVFNVAIRTLIINKRENKGEMGIGSGIVYDSDPKSEYAECLLKSKFLTSKNIIFQLIETILYRPRKGYFLLGLHLKRLKNSSKYFNFCYNERKIKNKLREISKVFKNDKFYKIRLLLSKDGNIKTAHIIIKERESKRPLKVKFSNKKTSSDNIFLYHKTTDRNFYNEQHKRCKKDNLYELIFRNEKNEATEGATSNIIVKKGKFYYTPPVDSGLLNGVYRQYLMNRKNFALREKVLYESDIIEADRVYMCNSVKGMQEVNVIL